MESVDTVFQAVMDHYGRIDILFNNAGAIWRVLVKQLNPTYGYDHRSDFLRCVSVIERLPCAKGAVSEAD